MAVNLADFSTATAMAEFKTRHQLWYSSQENASLATYMAEPANAVLLAVSTWDTLIGFTNSNNQTRKLRAQQLSSIFQHF